jgi:hypothetical protein
VDYDDKAGELEAKVAGCRKWDEGEGEWAPCDPGDAEFGNEYEPEPETVTLAATKTAVGKHMAAGQFGFALYESDAGGA